jgi:Tol biopolymer transport system component
LSRDGRKVAVAGAEILVWDLAGKMKAPLRPGGSQAPLWMPDGHLAFLGGQVMPTDGTITASPFGGGFPSGVTPDDTKALFTSNGDIMMVALDGTHRVDPLIHTEFVERNAVVSPNGRWLAYESKRTEKFEIYVKPFPGVDTGGGITISAAGGTQPLWSRIGDELFYVAPDGAILAVRVDLLSSTWKTVSSPAKVLEGGLYLTMGQTSSRTYDVSLDGKRILVTKKLPADTPPPHIILVQDWLEELKRLVPASR